MTRTPNLEQPEQPDAVEVLNRQQAMAVNVAWL